jgi:prepilin-type N-terminal cleavage/methylation domain-containing protein
MLARRRTRAFTLIEVMIVLVILSVLGLIATVAYRKWVRSSYMGEAQDMLQTIRAAEESFKAENGAYLNVSTDLKQTSLYPTASPAASAKVMWGIDPAWSALTVQASAPVRFGYAVVAGPANTAPPTITVNGSSPDLTAMAANPWFVAVAMCDEDNDSTTPPTTVYALSGDNHLLVGNDGQ